MAASRPEESVYYPYIDGLRAVAVLSVIVYHLDAAWLPGGFTGVDVFFVISGFVISASVSVHQARGLSTLLAYFYSRRLQRIAPALIVCLLATGVASALFIPRAWLSDTSHRVGLMAFFGLSNVALAGTEHDYFSPRVEFDPYAHTWSLGVEEQFYLLFPLLFFLWRFADRRRWLSLGLFVCGWVGSVTYAVWLSRIDPGRAFYMTGSRFWELASGVVLFQLLSPGGFGAERVAKPTTISTSLGALVSVALLATGLWRARPGMSPWPDGVLPVLGTLGVIGFLYGRSSGVISSVLGSRGAVTVGRVSYSLYLWHWPVLVLFRWTSGLESAVTRTAALVLTFALATLSYCCVERPVRYAPWLRVVPRPVVVLVALVVIGSAAFGYHEVSEHQDAVSLSVVTKASADWYPWNASTADASFPGCVVSARYENIGGASVGKLRREGCLAADGARRLFVIGDSHAVAYRTMLDQIVLETGSDVFLYRNGGCPFLSLRPSREYKDPRCSSYATRSMAHITSKAKAGDVIFLASLRLPRLAEQWRTFDEAATLESMFGADAAAARTEAEADAISVFRPLSERGVRVVLEAPPPIFRAPAFRCSDWFNRSSPLCNQGLTMPRELLERLRAPVLDAYRHIGAAVPGVTVWDPFQVLCPPAPTCEAVREGRPLFFDGDHLSGYANRLLAPDFRRHLAEVESSFRRAVAPTATVDETLPTPSCVDSRPQNGSVRWSLAPKKPLDR